MFTKEYVREVLEQMCVPYMTVPLSDEYVQKIYDDFVVIRNGEAVEHNVQRIGCTCRDNFATDEQGNCSWCHKPVTTNR